MISGRLLIFGPNYRRETASPGSASDCRLLSAVIAMIAHVMWLKIMNTRRSSLGSEAIID